MSERQCKEAELQISDLKLKYASLEETINERNKEVSRVQDELCSKRLELERQHNKVIEALNYNCRDLRPLGIQLRKSHC